MEETVERISLLKGDSEISGSVSDWDSPNFQMQSSVKLYVYCFNVNTKLWEPFIGLCPENNCQYIPWTLTFKVPIYNFNSSVFTNLKKFILTICS